METKGIQIGKKDVTVSLLTNDMIVYIKKSKNSTKELLQQINTFREVDTYKVNLPNIRNYHLYKW